MRVPLNGSGKDVELGRVIHSHVQHGVRRKMKLGQQEANRKDGRLSPEHQNGKGSQTTTPEAHLQDPEQIIPFREDTHQGSENGLLLWSDSTTGTDFGDPFVTKFVSTSASLSPRSQYLDPRTPSPPQSFSLDQLNPTISPSPSSHHLITCHAPSLLHYWTNVLLPERFPFDTRCTKLGQTRHAPAIHAELQELTAQPAHLYSILGAIAVHMLVRNGSLDIPNVNSFGEIAMIVDFRNQAQDTVQRSLQTGNVDLNTCRSLQCLTLIAFLTDMPEDAATHFATTMKAVDILGGLPTFDSYFIESELLNHWYGALCTLKKPAIILWSVVVEPAEVSRFRSRHSHRGHGVPRDALHSTGAIAQVSPAVAAILHDLSTALAFAQWLQTQSSEHYNAENCKWVALQHLAAGYRLLELQAADPAEEVLRIAGVYFVALTRGRLDQRCAAISVGMLGEALQRVGSALVGTGEVDGQGCLGCGREGGRGSGSAWMLWALTLGALAAEGTSEVGWFVSVLVEAARKVGVHSLADLERYLEGVIYEKGSLGVLLADFWHSHLAKALHV